MSQSKEVLDSVAQYLPEGLDEGTLEKVSELVAVIIEQRVEERVEDLTTKVQSFIRGNIEKGVLGDGSKGLLQRIYNDFSPLNASNFIDDLQNIVTDYMKLSSLTKN